MQVKHLIAIVAVFCFSVSASITITENSAQRLSFIFDIEDITLATYKKGDSTYSRISFQESNCRLYGDGEVSLPSKSLYVGVPQTGEIQIRFISQAVKRIALDHPLPSDSAGFHSYENVTPPFTNPWVSTVTYIPMRRMRTGHFFIRPFMYNPETHTVSVLQKGTCTIIFPAGAKKHGGAQPEGDFYAMLQKLVLNYPVAVHWLESERRTRPKRLMESVLPFNENMVRFDNGDGNSGVNECTSEENGILKIIPGDLSFLGSSLQINKISLFGAQREELNDTVPNYESIPDGAVEIPLMRVDQDNDGYFNGNDYLLAYVTGTSDWYYDSSEDDYQYQMNRMVTYRHYWIRKKGGSKNIASFTCSGSPVSAISQFENRIRFKRSLSLMTDGEGKGGIEWIWRRLDKGSLSFSYTLSLPDVNTMYPGYIFEHRGNYSSSYTLVMTFGDTVLSDTTKWRPFTNWNDSVLTFKIVNPSKSTFYELQSFDVRYTRNLDMTGKHTLRVFSPLEPDSAIVLYQLTNLPALKTYIFRLSSDERAVHLIDTVRTGGTYTWLDTAGIGVQYFICTDSGLITSPAYFNHYASVSDPSGIEITDLRNPANKADYIIITHNEFKETAKGLATHKNSIDKFSSVKVVDVNDVFREFSGGKFEPGAIRNFLLYTSYYWTPITAGSDPGPDYVVLFGLGHYDYKNYDTQEKNFIPTSQIRIQSAYKCVEDYFSCLDTGTYVKDNEVSPQLFLGRIPAGNTVEAQNVLKKIIEMEGAEADWSAWRNRVLLVSDDDRQGFEKDFIEHYIGNEDIGIGIEQQQPATEVRKVILFEYDWNELFQKPEATAALLNEINNGVAVVNYFGHGNQSAWADEGILNKDKVVNFTNYKRYPVVNSFSCAVAYFDKPDMTSLSELMITTADAGAIATIASTRTAFATKNTDMSKEFFRIFYENNTSWTLGQAYALTKQTENLKHYVLLGDPSIQFVNITDSVELTVTDEEGSLLDTIKALQTIVVSGNVVRNGITNTAFGTGTIPAYVQIGLYNPVQDSVKRKDGGTFSDPTYRLPGTPVFVGVLEVSQGRFRQKVLIPRNVTFKKPGVTLTAYAWNGTEFGLGYKGDLVFFGSEVNQITNNEGPRITVRPVYDTTLWDAEVGFTDKISSFLPLECEIAVWDEHGIDVSGIGPDEGLTFEVSGVMKENINNKFQFEGGQFTKGHANIVLESEDRIEAGVYDMIITAQDLLGKVSKRELTLEILEEEDFKLGHVFNYPNPVRLGQSTRFYFYHSNTSLTKQNNTDVTLKIFTLSGKLVRVFYDVYNGQVWDLTDQRGRLLPPNVYLYRVTAKMDNAGLDGSERVVKSPVKKLVIYPPR